MTTTTIAIDIAKDNFQIFGVDKNNKITIDKMMTRKKMMSFLVNHTGVEIFMESCAGSNFLCKEFNKMGHRAKRISPQHVKPYASYQKNDRNDAKAILEASRRPEALFVEVKAEWQQELQALHKIRDQKMKQYKAVAGQVRGFLFEHGFLVPLGMARFNKVIPEILEQTESRLSLIFREELRQLFIECRLLQDKVKELERTISKVCEEHLFYKLAQEELSGVGPLVASRFLCTIGSASNFKNGRQVSAHLGLVPRQNSSGGKQRLGRITKSGDVGLRTMIIQGSRAAIASMSVKECLSVENRKLAKRVTDKGFNKAAVALANQNTRRMWAIMRKCS
jgi:transposase